MPPVDATHSPSVSIIIPCRDEAGTVPDIVRRIPRLGKQTEIIFVEGFSTDGTWEEILRQQKKHKRTGFTIRAFKQVGNPGKKSAVDLGFSKAKGDILMILDADLSVDPEELRSFYAVAKKDPQVFVNGSRFIYPQEPLAMRYLNNIGNLCFALIFSTIFGQKVTDTLCGTKVLWRKEWVRLKQRTEVFGRHDPFGDFELFLGAYLLGLRIHEVPIQYRARVYGNTKISRFRDGARLLIVLCYFLRTLSRAHS